jgi:hypothetical protein
MLKLENVAELPTMPGRVLPTLAEKVSGPPLTVIVV